jgi:hypothetical protein
VDTAYRLLLSEITLAKETRDFEKLLKCHSDFLQKIHRSCFLESRVLCRIIRESLDLCLQLSSLIEQIMSECEEGFNLNRNPIMPNDKERHYCQRLFGVEEVQRVPWSCGVILILSITGVYNPNPVLLSDPLGSARENSS